MTTIVKPRKPLAEIAATAGNTGPTTNEVIGKTGANQLSDEEMTVEQYLEQQFEIIMQDFKKHAKSLIDDLRQEYQGGVKSVKDLMEENKSGASAIIITFGRFINNWEF